MAEFEVFEVGGCVRDAIMGQKPKDIDFTVVTDSFEHVRVVVKAHGMRIVQDKEEFGTIRAVAKTPFMGHKGGLDFVWARIDGPSSDGRRPDWTRPGSLMDDLGRRDFTMNAIAKDARGNLIDPFGGQQDIKEKVIRCVGSAEDRIMEDALRGIRALRFSVTKGFTIDGEIWDVLDSEAFRKRLDTISTERIREEMEKMFMHDTTAAFEVFATCPPVFRTIFRGGRIRLTPTMKA